jgi:hypothetical protein
MRTRPGIRRGRVAAPALLATLGLALAVSSLHAERAVAAAHISTVASPTPGSLEGAVRPGNTGPHPSGPGDPAGNLSVVVPVVPPPAVIGHLCRDLASGRRAEPAVWLPALVGVTGGNLAATTKWCETYLSLQPPDRQGRPEGNPTRGAD